MFRNLWAKIILKLKRGTNWSSSCRVTESTRTWVPNRNSLKDPTYLHAKMVPHNSIPRIGAAVVDLQCPQEFGCPKRIRKDLMGQRTCHYILSIGQVCSIELETEWIGPAVVELQHPANCDKWMHGWKDGQTETILQSSSLFFRKTGDSNWEEWFRNLQRNMTLIKVQSMTNINHRCQNLDDIAQKTQPIRQQIKFDSNGATFEIMDGNH